MRAGFNPAAGCRPQAYHMRVGFNPAAGALADPNHARRAATVHHNDR
jgi:hypothetical protein